MNSYEFEQASRKTTSTSHISSIDEWVLQKIFTHMTGKYDFHVLPFHFGWARIWICLVNTFSGGEILKFDSYLFGGQKRRYYKRYAAIALTEIKRNGKSDLPLAVTTPPVS